ncbi:Pre-mRNA-splicing factor CWC22 OS=Cryptococcus neoformans var, neoformans serotype D (strain JEC21 / ATCC MYA-565) GN=CWC22 PE=3 SV=1 [Rhizoctonia solani AG-1 IB]|uniref:Pre-mRNA-splicing factor CWC22 n=1 Tax=Thanatephorus cucumeris (strain AG1-IB / isolate 7/3/14) TaxID=1108050 RepID=A0A0B7F6B6_THACB|nr:Pre-mRNA-splicing factor CWC22 OS=Cryptococcus neoformans var, neoformans serotype D (strain JEC21 / ATCC MYA-565) GN=CWC22 PE=3 SV=1 [Rhizoctonia solani AG-1 IB]
MSDIEVDKVENYDGDSKPKRKRELSGSRSRSRTRSPRRSPSPPRTRRRKSSSPPLSNHRRDPDGPNVRDVDPERRKERERQLALRMAEIELGTAPPKPEFDAKAEFAKLLNSRSGGVYVPPARLRALQAAAAEDKSSAEYQRLSWDALRKSITGIVNRVNIANIKHVIPELFQENLVRGRGLFARSIMKAQAASLPFTPIFAALVAVINTKLPQVGELLLTRLISQFRRSFKRNDKIVCHSTTTFIAHLVNQGVAHEIIALQILVLLLEQPTDDSVEIAVGFMREVGAYLAENSPRANNGVYERFRAVLHEGNIDKRVQYMIEVLFQVRKDKYKDNVVIPEGLDLVEEDDQITHQISLDDELQIQEGLNVFKFDPNYLENEEKYKEIKTEILGDDSDDESGGSGSESDNEEDDEEAVAGKPGITDMTETNLVNLRRTIYLTIMNALSYEEAVHKMMKVNIQEGQEIELCNMIVECCSQERSYSNYYGLIGERFCKLNRVWCESFEEAFANYYETIHRYETNRLRNIARFFGHLIATDAMSWAVFSVVKINEDDTTSSSRIFVKILMQELQESMGLKTMSERFKDPTMRESFTNMFPMDDPTGKSTRFAVNYFTALGLGVLTEDMRANLLENARKIAAIRDLEAQRAAMEESSSSDSSDSTTSSDDSSDSDSDSDSDDSRYARRRRSRSRSRSPPHRRNDSRRRGSYSPRRSESPERGAPRRKSYSPRRGSTPPRRRRRSSPSVSRSPSTPPPPRRGSPRRSGRDDSPARKGGRDDSPPPRGGRDASPRRRSSPPPRDRRESPPPRDSRRDDSARDRRRDDSPPPGRRRASPPRDRRRDSPPPRDRRRDSPPHDRRRDDSPPRDRRRASPPRDSRRDESPRRRHSPPPPRRHRDSPPRTTRDRSPTPPSRR